MEYWLSLILIAMVFGAVCHLVMQRFEPAVALSALLASTVHFFWIQPQGGWDLEKFAAVAFFFNTFYAAVVTTVTGVVVRRLRAKH